LFLDVSKEDIETINNISFEFIDSFILNKLKNFDTKDYVDID
jgi:hypothetical protein